MKRSELKKVIAEYQEINEQINQLEKRKAHLAERVKRTWETARRNALTILSSGSRLWKAIALTCPRSRNSTAIFTRRLHVTPSQGGFRSHEPESKGNL